MPTSAVLPELAERAKTPCWDNLNKLEWPAGFAFESYGVPIGIRVSDPSLLPRLRAVLPPDAEDCDVSVVERYLSVILGGRKPGSRSRAFHLVYVDHSLLSRSHDLEDVLQAFASWIRLSVADFAPDRIFVHAGVVGWKGRAILVPGKSLTGKSTLIAEFVKAGATYYSDEYAVLDERGLVYPYVKPLSLRTGSDARQTDVAVEEIGGRVGETPLPVGLVVASEYEPGARWRPEKLSHGIGILELLSNTVSARRSADRALNVFEAITSTAPVLKSKRGDAAGVVQQILSDL